MSKNFLTWKSSKKTPAVLSFGKLWDENGNSYEWINGQKPHLIKNGIRRQCDTENFVPIVVPGLSTSSPSSFPSSTSMTPSRQERPCSTLLHQRQRHQVIVRLEKERIDLKGDTSPVPVSISHVDERMGQPVVRRSRSGCKDSGKIWWVMKFLYAETLTPVLLMKFL